MMQPNYNHSFKNRIFLFENNVNKNQSKHKITLTELHVYTHI